MIALKSAVSCAVVQGSVGYVGAAEGVDGREGSRLRLRVVSGVLLMLGAAGEAVASAGVGGMEGVGEAAEVAVRRARFLGGMMGAW